MSAPAVKICGIVRPEDARAAVEAGADYLGAILSPGFSRSIAAERAAAFVTSGADVSAETSPGDGGPPAGPVGADAGGGESPGVPARPSLVAVLVDPSLEDAVAAARTSGASVLQLHGEEPPSLLRTLRDEGGWTLWKALQVRSADDVRRAFDRYADVADGLLLDGWHRGRGGGVGAAFPWEVVEPVRAAFPASLAFIAAGGLGASNVAEAVRRLSPDVVDVSSGVEARVGEKDPAQIRAFVRSARAAGPAAAGTPAPGRGPESP